MLHPPSTVPDPWGAPGRTGLKVCCIASIEEALAAVAYGADAIGLVSAMPSGPGVIPEPLIAEIAAAVPRHAATVLLTSSCDVADIIDQQRRCGVSAIQLCDRLAPAAVAELRGALPGISLLQVVHVVDEDSVAEARAAAVGGWTWASWPASWRAFRRTITGGRHVREATTFACRSVARSGELHVALGLAVIVGNLAVDGWPLLRTRRREP